MTTLTKLSPTCLMVFWLQAFGACLPLSIALAAPASKPKHDVTMRQVMPEQAYRERVHLGPHVNFKVTPNPGGDGAGQLLIEVYNYSPTYLNVVDFWLGLTNTWGDRLDVHVSCDDVKPKWSAVKWVKVQGKKTLPRMDSATIQNLKAYDENGRQVNVKYYIDLIQTNTPGKPNARPTGKTPAKGPGK